MLPDIGGREDGRETLVLYFGQDRPHHQKEADKDGCERIDESDDQRGREGRGAHGSTLPPKMRL